MKLDKNLRDKMRGLLPFDSNAIEQYTPVEYAELPKEYQPVFYLKPWNQGQKDSVTLTVEQLQNAKNSEDKKLVNQKLNEFCRQNITDLKQWYDIGSEKFVETEKKDGAIDKKVWDSVPVKIQTSVYFCLSRISGLLHSEEMGL